MQTLKGFFTWTTTSGTHTVVGLAAITSVTVLTGMLLIWREPSILCIFGGLLLARALR